MIALGIALLLNARLGVAPYDVMNTGLSSVLGLSFSVIYFAMSLLGFTLGGLLGTRIGVASVIGTFVIGPMISLFRGLVPEPEQLAVRSGMLLAATCFWRLRFPW